MFIINKDSTPYLCYFVFIGSEKYVTLIALLSEDPRPGYSNNINNKTNRNNTSKEYGVSFAGINVRFVVNNKILVVTDVTKL